MIDPVTLWLEIMQYDNKRAMILVNWFEAARFAIYPRLTEIMYDQGSEFICHEFRKSLIEIQYGITAKPSTSVNPVCNAILVLINQVLGNLVRTCNITQTYVDEDDPWSGILDAALFTIKSKTNRLKGYSPGQLLFGSDMFYQENHITAKYQFGPDYIISPYWMLSELQTLLNQKFPSTGLFCQRRFFVC